MIEGSAAGYRSVLSAKPQAELVSEQGEQETPDPGEPVEFSEQEAQAGSPRKSQIRLFCGTWEPVAPMLREKLRIHAASKPGATRAGLQDSARTRPRGHYLPPGFDTIQRFSTRHQRFAFARLSGSHLTGLGPAFSCDAHHHRS